MRGPARLPVVPNVSETKETEIGVFVQPQFGQSLPEQRELENGYYLFLIGDFESWESSGT